LVYILLHGCFTGDKGKYSIDPLDQDAF